MIQSPITNINVGTNANDGTGDPVRTAFQKTNSNFSYLTSYSIIPVTNNSVVDTTNSGVKKIVLNGVGTISNVWINLPISTNNGTEMKITSLVPITSCWVTQGGQSIQWLSNSFFSSGNVSTTLTYTTTNNSWMTF